MVQIDIERDKRLTEFATKLLQDYYLIEGEKHPSEAFARASEAFSGGDEELAQRLYDYASKGWFMYSSPILANAPRKGEKSKGLPIACYLSYVPDSLKGLIDHSSEIRWLSVKGGGTAGAWSDVRPVSKKAPGPMPFLKTMDSDMVAYKQSSIRRGSYAAYLDVSHPDLIEFLQMRVPTGGNPDRKMFNLHNAVNITDAFLEAVKNNVDWNLIDPSNGEIRETHKARDIWELILETRFRTGEPYIIQIDEANRRLPEPLKSLGLRIQSSNLCVAPETLILTSKGYLPIKDIANQEVNIWNGEEFSTVIPRKTGENQRLVKIEFSDGSNLECTEYHRFFIQRGYIRGTGKNKLEIIEKKAKELIPGDKLIKCNYPVINGTTPVESPYTQGFFSGDGCTYKEKNHIDLYGAKIELAEFLDGYFIGNYQPSQDRHRFKVSDNFKKYHVPINSSIEDKLLWFAGLADSDGVATDNQGTNSIQISSTNKDFIQEVSLMLTTLGVKAKVVPLLPERETLLPNHKDGYSLYTCKACYRLLVNGSAIETLNSLGFKTHRLVFSDKIPNRDASQFIKILSVTDEGRRDDTYCFTEEKKGKGIFNGILAGNCSEIFLPTNEERTAVCCLSSVNLEYFEDWKDTSLIADLITMLDNVIEHFIQNAPDELSKARYSASRERSLGLGAMGLHNFFQKKGIAFGSLVAKGWNNKIFKYIREEADKQTRKLAIERGEYPDGEGSGRRNAHTCVSGDMTILTKQGLYPIKDLVGKEVEIWNGFEWSRVTPYQTGQNQKLFKVSLSNGRHLVCTENHNWKILSPRLTNKGNLVLTVPTNKLRVNDCIPKTLGSVMIGDKLPDLPYAYTSGVFCGDGSLNNARKGKYPRNEIRLYAEKKQLVPFLDWKSEKPWSIKKGENLEYGVRGYLVDNLLPKFQVPINYSLQSRLDWLAGLIDTDGSANPDRGIQITTSNPDFAYNLLHLLQTLGCFGDISIRRRKEGDISQNPCYHIALSNSESQALHDLGLKTHRVNIPKCGSNGISSVSRKKLVYITDIEEVERGDSFCLTEPKQGTCVFNGVYTAQCAVAPNANNSVISGTSPSIEPIKANAYTHRTRAGSFLVKNKFLEETLKKLNQNTEEVWSSIIVNDGSVQHLDFLDEATKEIYKTAMEIDQRWIVDLARDRQQYLDQGQSVNLFFPAGTPKQYVHDVHWRAFSPEGTGVPMKGLYYLRSTAGKAAEKVAERIERDALKDHDSQCIGCEG